jgi:CRISPR-associated exonuclease Cas4
VNTDEYVVISALQHYAYCPRQCALIHIEQLWAENYSTAKGKLLHQRVDGGDQEKRGNLKIERSVAVVSHRLRIKGKLDVLEIIGSNPCRFYPVEYKRGKTKIEDWDRIQLCAQAMCLEEMRNVKITEGALWYGMTRKREPINFDEILRSKTAKLIGDVEAMLANKVTPRPVFGKHCMACSLIDLCEPKMLEQDRSVNYVDEIFGQ